jgi:tetrahydromethanopterin:alpha-L-glutamate ligase
MSPSPDAVTPLPAAAAPRIALMSDGADWHSRTLMREFAAAGARTRMVNLSACGIDTVAGGLELPGFAHGLPDAVMVRIVPGGSFEAVTLRLGILHALDAIGIPVWNSARAIERCVDKSMTSFLLARAGIPTPPTWAVQSTQQAAAIVERESAPLVLKPLFGSQGRGLQLIRSAADLPAPTRIAGVYYLQRYVGVERQGFHDFRVLVVRGRVVAAMMRHASHWITNVKRGGKPVSAVADATMKELAIAAAAAVGADFAGVDIIHDAAGRAMVLEVNSMPAWSGLQRTTSIDIAAVLAGEFVAMLTARAQRVGA